MAAFLLRYSHCKYNIDMKKTMIILGLMLLVSIALNVWFWNREPQVETMTETKTDTLWKDTAIYEPHAVDSQKTGKVIFITLPPLPGDTIHDSIMVSLDIEQKRYEDSLYTAWVSGYQPALDSINLRLPTITNTFTITNTIQKQSPRISFGVQAGAGYGLFSRTPDIYLGVGGQIRF